MPNQSAILMIVPRLPGSCTLSSISDNLPFGLSSLLGRGKGKTPNTCWGCRRKLTFRNSSSVAVTTSVSSGNYFPSSQSWVATNSLACLVSKRSPTIFGPSATKAFSISRYFFWSSERISLVFALLIIVLAKITFFKWTHACLTDFYYLRG